MEIMNPMRNTTYSVTSDCACVCDTGSAYWNTSGVSISTHCGCQCIEGNSINSSANLNLATSKA